MTFDSNEEMYFSWYLDELKDNGYISSYSRSKSYVLSEPLTSTYIKQMKRVANKIIDYSYLRGHIYTPDFCIEWTEKARGIFFHDCFDTSSKINNFPFMTYITEQDGKVSICSEVEVKAIFDQNNMTRLAIINIKWLYDKFEILTTVIKPQKLFKETFTPDKYLTTNKSKQGRKIQWKVNSISEFINK